MSSLRYIRPGGKTPSLLGSVHETRPNNPRSFSPLMPAVRDFGTPDMTSSPRHLQPHAVTPGFPGGASASTYAPQPSIPQTLQAIQVSLTALHERLSTLERSQAIILRRDERRKSWRIFGGGEADELDEAEDAAYRARWGVGRTDTATTTHPRARRSLSARALFMLLTALRRAMLDVGVGVLLTVVAVVILGGGWRRARRTLTRVFLRARHFIQES